MEAQIKATNNFRLLDLSTELIQMIVTELRSRDDLCAVALMCRQLQRIVDELLRYHSVSIKLSHDCQPRQRRQLRQLRSRRRDADELRCLRRGDGQRQCQIRGENQLKSLVQNITERPRLAAMIRRVYFFTHNMELEDLPDDSHAVLDSCLGNLPNLEELSFVATYTLTRSHDTVGQMPSKCSLLLKGASLLGQPKARLKR